MQEKRERWMELALAADQDPDRLAELVKEMLALLEAKENRLSSL